MEYRAVIKKNSNEELQHYGVLGMKWGVIKSKYNESRNRKHRLVSDLDTARTGNRITSKNGSVLTRKKYAGDDPAERKKRIDADIKEADDRVKYYGSKRAAKAAIDDEARYAENVNRGKAAINTLVFGGSGALAGSTLMALAANSAAAAAIGGAAPLIGVGLVSAAAATKANNYIKKHAQDQVLYTEDSEYAHDVVVTFKKND